MDYLLRKTVQDELCRIPGIGDALAATVTDRFPSLAALNDAMLAELHETSRITPELAIHIKAQVCDPPETFEAIDETSPRLADRIDIADTEIQQIQTALSERSTGRDSDLENLIRHSFAAHKRYSAAYRGAFENHCKRIADDISEYPGGSPISHAEGPTDKEFKDWNDLHREQQMRNRRSRQMDDVDDFIAVFLDTEGPFATKIDAIIAVKVVFDPVTPKALPGYLIADLVGCSSGYASEFEPVRVADRSVVLRKEYAARRQLEKAETWQRKAVLRRDGEECVRCKAIEDLVVHHITPVEAGGSDDLDNMATLCRSCHHDVHGDVASTAEVVYDSGAFWEWASESG